MVTPVNPKTNSHQLEQQMESWHNEKIKISKNIEIPFFREGQVWFISMGLNIGFEENGKNGDFSRPVLILKKFSKDTFLGIPTTTIKKEGKFYENIGELNKKQNYLLLSQIRLYSSKRLLSNIGGISKHKLKEIKEKIKKLIE